MHFNRFNVDDRHCCSKERITTQNDFESNFICCFIPKTNKKNSTIIDFSLLRQWRTFDRKLIVISLNISQSTPCKHPVIVLQDVAFNDLHALVEFIYHGEVNVHQRSLSSFLKTAEVLRVSGLTQQQAEETHNVCETRNTFFARS